MQPRASSQQPACTTVHYTSQPDTTFILDNSRYWGWRGPIHAAQYSVISVRYIRGMNISIEITKSFMCHKIKFIPSLDLSAISIEWCGPGRGGAGQPGGGLCSWGNKCFRKLRRLLVIYNLEKMFNSAIYFLFQFFISSSIFPVSSQKKDVTTTLFIK